MTKVEKTERPQAFDLFSPIPVVDEKQSKVTDIKNQPRVLSLDSGNFSVVSKHESQNLMTMSGDALRPVVVHATSDSISTVSMNDISNWYNGEVFSLYNFNITLSLSSLFKSRRFRGTVISHSILVSFQFLRPCCQRDDR